MNAVQSNSSQSHSEFATLGGGCFWCLEALFNGLRGVERVESGYSGGSIPNPTYEQVCSGTTGHAEVVRITFDPKTISFRDILDVFFSTHDPTTLNRQGADMGTQYRSVIFYHTPEQRAIAEETIQELDAGGRWSDPIVTEVKPFAAFYPAEEYHQRYYEQNSEQGYCRMVIAPKLAKLRKQHSAKLS